MKINIMILMMILTFIVLLNISCRAGIKEEAYIEREISIIPKPARMEINKGNFIISSTTKILVEAGNEEIKRIG